MSDTELMKQAMFALSFAPKEERNPELESTLKELDSIDNLNNNPMAIRTAGMKAARLAYVMGAKWGMKQWTNINRMKTKALFDWSYVKRTIRNHYGLTRPVTDKEAQDEVANLKRRHSAGTLDDSYERLYSMLSVGKHAVDLS